MNGPSSVRCAWIGEAGMLGGFTLRNGSTPLNGGGVWSAEVGLRETMVGCVITNCRAAGNGGAVYQGRLRECVLAGNAAGTNGGGAALTVLDRCLLQGNSTTESHVQYGGGGPVWG